jgi:hypothetical protein
MKTQEAVKIVDDLAGIADRIKHEIVTSSPKRVVFQEIYTLRRSVEKLEREVRDRDTDTLGEAC